MSGSNVNHSVEVKDQSASSEEAETLEEVDDAPPKVVNGTATTTAIDGRGRKGIAAMLKSSGPVVKCVLLKHMRSSGRDVHPHLDASVITEKLHQYRESTDVDTTKATKSGDEMNAAPQQQQQPHHHREVLTELIEEIEVDTTPGKNEVQKILGGNAFTFVGQYPDEGIVLMARADQFHDIEMIDDLSVLELKDFILDANLNIDITKVVDKSELIQAVKDAQLPLNPHQLQPPFHDCPIRGDILLMRVSDDDDDDDDEGEEDDDANNNDDDDADNDDNNNNNNNDDDRKVSTTISKAIKEITAATEKPNDEFFLDYTKDEYIAFASRTDIVASPTDGDDDDDYGDDDDDDDDDEEDYDEGEEAEDEEEDKHLLLNLILGEVIKSFREDNGRGPDSVELLDLRARIAQQLNLSLPPPAPPIPDDERKRKKAEASLDDKQQEHSTSPSPKKVKFNPDVLENEEEQETNVDPDEHKTIDIAKEGNDDR